MINKKIVVMVDVRSLQDPYIRYRGIGQHGYLLLRTARSHFEGKELHLIGFCDRELPKLDNHFSELFNELITNARNVRAKVNYFINISPMTHSIAPIRIILNDTKIRKFAIAYDLIPMMDPSRYLPSAASKALYLTSCASLGSYDRIFAISEYAAKQINLSLEIPADKISVTGCAIRPSLLDSQSLNRATRKIRHKLLVTGGEDRRKNPECALLAHARSKFFQRNRIDVIISGNYTSASRQSMLNLVEASGGSKGLVSFTDHLEDAELGKLYRDSILTVVPSYLEGFSLPVIEAAANGSVVLASNASAHPELIQQEMCLFDPDSDRELGEKMERLFCDTELWNQIQTEQSGLLERFSSEAVSERFWSPIASLRTDADATLPPTNGTDNFRRIYIAKKCRPSVSVITPLPPTLSGVANFSLKFIKALSAKADVHVFSSSLNSAKQDFYSSINSITSVPYTSPIFDATITVLGNSVYHLEGFRYLRDYGGSVVLHDARMIDFYVDCVGMDKAANVASLELRRPVDQVEIGDWINKQKDLPCLFLSEICESAKHLFVHSEALKNIIHADYGAHAFNLPFPLCGSLLPNDVTPEARFQARADLLIPEPEIVIATFGFVSEEKEPYLCLEAFFHFRKRNKNSRLVFCGWSSPLLAEKIKARAREIGVLDSVYLTEEPVPREIYQKWLLAADAAIQLRTYDFGQMSGAVDDCIGAAIPSVISESLGRSTDTPDFLNMVPPGTGAEEISEALDSSISAYSDRPILNALHYAERFSFENYCAAMLRGLEIEF